MRWKSDRGVLAEVEHAMVNIQRRLHDGGRANILPLGPDIRRDMMKEDV